MTATTIKFLGLVLGSLILSLWHFGPLRGSLFSLFLTVGSQVFLFGYLSARALGLWRVSENVVLRLAWIVSCGLGITIVLGAGARLLLLPVYVYVVGLHVFMLLLSLTPAVTAPAQPVERKALPFYLLLVLTCIVFMFTGWERNRMRFDAYPDQALPVSLADWWAHTSSPENLVSRNVVDTRSVTYWSSDGLTYVFAAWVWTGGFSAVQLIWYALTPLFVWLAPVAHFAFAYRLTRRADTAAWAAAATLILALTTILSGQQVGGFWFFGQEAAFQLTTLRTFSTALLMPLVLFVFFTTLRSPGIRHYLMASVIVMALALTHPRQYLAMLTGLYAVLGIGVLVIPSRARLRTIVLLGLTLLPSLIVPIWQYTHHLEGTVSEELLPGIAAAASISRGIISPDELLFNPLIPLALFLSIASILRLRRSLTAQFVFATSLVMFTLSYVPPIFNSILRMLGSYFGLHYVLELFFIVPFGLILGIAVSFLRDQLSQRLQLRSRLRLRLRSRLRLRRSLRLHAAAGSWLIAGGFAVTALVLLVEPFPIRQSARDQLNAAHQIQFLRDIRPFDEQLLNRLNALPATADKVVYVTSNRIASYVIESVPNAFVTGGRSEANPAYDGSSRFFDGQNAPWLDAADIEFLQTYHPDYLVLSADNPRIPQLLLQPERFEWVDSAAGYHIFRVLQVNTLTDADRAFARMNLLYQAEAQRRWDADGFHPITGTDTRLWQPVILEWQEQLARDPDNDLARYGLAFALLMAGSSQSDLWASLSAAYPDIFLLADVNAHLLRERGQGQAAVDLLADQLASAQTDEAVLAAKTLLTEPFFSLLTPEQLDSIIALADSSSSTWSHLMEWNHADALRRRAALLMSAGRLEAADQWLSRLPEVEISPRDLVTRASIQLAQGNIDAARMLLQPAADPDWVQPHYALHWENWRSADNTAARLYQMLSAASDTDLSPSLMAETGMIFAMQPEIEQRDNQLSVSVVLGDFAPALPPQSVMVRVTSADSAVLYAETVVPTTIANGSLRRVTISLDLPPDLPTETPALAVIEAQYSPEVIYQTLVVETVLSPTGR